MFQHILVATDGSLLSEAAVDKAMNFAREAGAKVTVITATEPFQRHGNRLETACRDQRHV